MLHFYKYNNSTHKKMVFGTILIFKHFFSHHIYQFFIDENHTISHMTFSHVGQKKLPTTHKIIRLAKKNSHPENRERPFQTRFVFLGCFLVGLFDPVFLLLYSKAVLACSASIGSPGLIRPFYGTFCFPSQLRYFV